jgi:hypothetical protein
MKVMSKGLPAFSGSRLSDDIGGHDRREPALDPLFAQRSLPEALHAKMGRISLTLLLGRKPINGAAGRLGPRCESAGAVPHVGLSQRLHAHTEWPLAG